MALRINQGPLFDDGINEYWRISDYRIYEQAKQGDIVMSGYPNKQSFLDMEAAGIKSNTKTIIRISIPDFETYFTRTALEGENIFAVMYRYVRSCGTGFEEAEEE